MKKGHRKRFKLCHIQYPLPHKPISVRKQCLDDWYVTLRHSRNISCLAALVLPCTFIDCFLFSRMNVLAAIFRSSAAAFNVLGAAGCYSHSAASRKQLASYTNLSVTKSTATAYCTVCAVCRSNQFTWKLPIYYEHRKCYLQRRKHSPGNCFFYV